MPRTAKIEIIKKTIHRARKNKSPLDGVLDT